MRRISIVAVLLVTLALAACGGGAASSPPPAESRSPEPSRKPRLAMSKAEIAKLPQYKIRAMPPPAPRKLVVKDLWKGFGAALKPGDDFLVDFVGIRYSHAYETTPATQNEPIKFGFEEVMAGWRKGLPGMKVGGRRQLIVPPRLGSVSATAVYVIDLLAVYPAG